MIGEDYKEAARLLRTAQWIMEIPEGAHLTRDLMIAEKLVVDHTYTASEVRRAVNPQEAALVAHRAGENMPVILAAMAGPEVADTVVRYWFPEISSEVRFSPFWPHDNPGRE